MGWFGVGWLRVACFGISVALVWDLSGVFGLVWVIVVLLVCLCDFVLRVLMCCYVGCAVWVGLFVVLCVGILVWG